MPKRGITLMDLFLPAGAQALIPDAVASQLSRMVVIDHRSVTTPETFVHTGLIQSIADSGLPALNNWPVEAPGLNRGLKFQLTFVRDRRAPADPARALEPAALSFQLDLFLERVAIKLIAPGSGRPLLRAARLVADDGANPAHLEPEETRQEVRIVGDAVMRLAPGAGGGPLTVRFIDWPDPLAADAPTGAVFRLRFDPPHFFFGDSRFGMTVDRLTYDASDVSTPQDIAETGRGPQWTGLSIYQATFYCPPGVANLSFGVRDFLLGIPAGDCQGEARIEFGQLAAEVTYARALGLSFSDETLPGRHRALTPTLESDGHTITVPLPSPRFEEVTTPSGERIYNTSDSRRVRVTASPTTSTRAVTLRWLTPRDGRLEGNPPRPFEARPGERLGVQARLGTGAEAVDWPEVTVRFTQERATEPTSDAAPQINLVLAEGGDTSAPRRFFYPNVTHISSVHGILRPLPPAPPPRREPDPLDEPVFNYWIGPPRETPPPRFDYDGWAWYLYVFADPPSDDLRWRLATSNEFPFPVHLETGTGGTYRFVLHPNVPTTYTLTLSTPSGRTRRMRVTVEVQGAPAFGHGTHPSTPSLPLIRGLDETTYRPTGVSRVYDLAQFHATGNLVEVPEPTPASLRPFFVEGRTPDAATLNSLNGKLVELEIDHGNRFILVPGRDAPPPAPPAPRPREPVRPWLGRLVARWNYPALGDLADAIPTLLEATFKFTQGEIPLPGRNHPEIQRQDPQAALPGRPARTPAPGGSRWEVWTVAARWTYDVRTTLSSFSASLDSTGDPDGLVKIVDGSGFGHRALAAALAIAPGLVAGLAARDNAVQIGALVGAGVAAAFLTSRAKVVLYGVRLSTEFLGNDVGARPRVRAQVDYGVSLAFDTAGNPALRWLGLRTRADRPLRVRYRGVGLELRLEDGNFDELRFVYDDASFELEDPGAWQIGGALAEVLRVTGVRAGAGSAWFELDLGFTLDLGVIRIEGATVRLTFSPEGPPLFELRGLAARIDLPGVLRGEGRLAVGDGGRIAGTLGVEVIPAKVQARASVTLDGELLGLEIAVLLPVGLPLGSTGLGIFGFRGRFVVNGRRRLPPNDDPIQQEIDWYRASLESKYTGEDARGHWALGLGAIVGTLPDRAFTFNAEGSLAISFPDVSVVFGIDAAFLKSATLTPSETPSARESGPSATLLGLLAIDPTAVKVGIRGRYDLRRVIRAEIPISAYFPLGGSDRAWYIRIGSDGVAGRTGSPVLMTLLPGILDFRIWAYLMIEQRELPSLGGEPSLSFQGFSIGFGCGWEVEWSAGPIRLSASARLLVGLGTRPFLLAGQVRLRGELSLVIVSLSVSAQLDFRVTEAQDGSGTIYAWLHGQVCARLNLFFFSVEGCLSLTIGRLPPAPVLAPPPPLAGVDLTDHGGAVVARAAGPDAAALSASDALPTVWPDTIPVLHFEHPVEVAGGGSFAIDPCEGPTGWGGTTELKYAFRLDGVELVEIDPAGVAPARRMEGLPSRWWLPSHRPGLTREGEPSGSSLEGRELGLLWSHPAPWARLLGEAGGEAPGDPARTLRDVCGPTPAATRAFALGRNYERVEASRLRLRPDSPSAPPFSSWFELTGTETFFGLPLEQASAVASDEGFAVEPGGLVPLEAALALPESAPPLVTAAAYSLARIVRYGGFYSSLQFDGTFDHELAVADLVLALTLEPDQHRRPPDLVTTHAKLEPEPDELSVEGRLRVLIGGETGAPPLVYGITPGGVEVAWIPYPISATAVRYISPGGGPWRGVRIMPWTRGRVAVVSASGVTRQAERGRAQDEEARRRFRRRWEEAAAADAAGLPVALRSGMIYEMRCAWRWAGWAKSEDEPAPPEPESATWREGAPLAYRFRTAVEGAPDAAPLDLRDESRFDPRGVARYLIAFEPGEQSPPHFCDDPVRVHFSVSHLRALLERYGRGLRLEVRKTNLPAGSAVGRTDAGLLEATLLWTSLADHLQAHSDRRLLEEGRRAPCLGGDPALGGASALVSAVLEPAAEYDLVLVSTRDGTDPLLIARSHFRTSRYRDPGELFEALGFGGRKRPAVEFLIPPDAGAGLPAAGDVRKGSDAALEQALAAAGMDPWPLPRAPRTVLIWQRARGAWFLAGLLLEADEPIDRPPLQPGASNRNGRPRLEVRAAHFSGQTFTPVRSDCSGSRVLLAAAAPVGVGASGELVLEASVDVEAAGEPTEMRGSRAVKRAPRVVTMEGGL